MVRGLRFRVKEGVLRRDVGVQVNASKGSHRVLGCRIL